jgi:hypothetical protein
VTSQWNLTTQIEPVQDKSNWYIVEDSNVEYHNLFVWNHLLNKNKILMKQSLDGSLPIMCLAVRPFDLFFFYLQFWSKSELYTLLRHAQFLQLPFRHLLCRNSRNTKTYYSIVLGLISIKYQIIKMNSTIMVMGVEVAIWSKQVLSYIVMAYSLIFKAGNTITFGVVDFLPVNTSSYWQNYLTFSALRFFCIY